ncbi:MAG: UvrD-helicase domain-containing protein, partial [Bacteroidota bacterium]|nr:UvrD-helicase domain-containing protein [Bacteroidota bacterium]
DEPVPFIYERLGERYRHFLIDEFQDTSLQQWNALLPLIDNALGTNGSALLVGDAKQAIYRWRNGEVRLFRDLPKLFGNGTDQVSQEREGTLVRNFKKSDRLEFNHRSAGTIIEFNNNLFGSLKEQLAPDLQDIYRDHDQQVIKTGPGLIHLEKLEKEITGDSRKEEILRFALKAVEDSINDGFSPGDIAVLVRSRSLGSLVAAELVSKEYSVVSPDGLQLSGDPVIELLIDLLRFIHTADAEAAARIAQYRAIVAAEKANDNEVFSTEATLPDPLSILRNWFKKNASPRLRTTLTGLISELARASGIKPAEDAQVLALLDEAHAWTGLHGQDIGGFLDHWTRIGNQRSVDPPENGQAIQVMTIHRSKGLQFPVVIIPNACMSGKGDHGERIWIKPGDAVPELDVALVRTGKLLREAHVPEVEEEATLSILDSLDLLYVAFTRPEQRLYAKVQISGADGITRELLRFMDEHGVAGALIDGERTGPWKEKKASAAELLIDVSMLDPALPISIRYEAPSEWEPADPDPYRAHGNMVHELLAEVNSAADLDRTISTFVARGDLTKELAGMLRDQLTPLIGSEAFAPWFSDHLTVISERTIITASGHALRPDRVVIDGDVVRVLDIKTGKAYDDHIDQVQEYMRHLKELTLKKVEGALFYVREGKLQPITLNEREVLSEAVH